MECDKNVSLLENAQRWASKREFYIGRSTLLCQFIEQVTFACCMFIFALQNITLDGYLDTRIYKHLWNDGLPEIYII